MQKSRRTVWRQVFSVWKNFIVVICSNRIFITEYEKSLLNRGYHDKLLLNYNILKVYVESRK